MSRILVVDDEESIRLTLATFLSNAGYEVEAAENVPAALKQLKAGNFDVVVSDEAHRAMLAEAERLALEATVARAKTSAVIGLTCSKPVSAITT